MLPHVADSGFGNVVRIPTVQLIDDIIAKVLAVVGDDVVPPGDEDCFRSRLHHGRSDVGALDDVHALGGAARDLDPLGAHPVVALGPAAARLDADVHDGPFAATLLVRNEQGPVR